MNKMKKTCKLSISEMEEETTSDPTDIKEILCITLC